MLTGTYRLQLEPIPYIRNLYTTSGTYELVWYGVLLTECIAYSPAITIYIFSSATHDGCEATARITGSPPGSSYVRLLAGRLIRVDLGLIVG